MGSKNKKRKPVVNMGAIKRNLIIRDTGLDSRFTTQVVPNKKKRKDKHKKDWRDEA
jgi:hypothetical protein